MDALAARFRLGRKVLRRHDNEGWPFILNFRVSPESITRDVLPIIEDSMWRYLRREGLGVLGLVNASRGWRPVIVPGHGIAPALEVPDTDWLAKASDLIGKADGIVVELPAGQSRVPEELQACRAAGRSLLTLVIRPPSEPSALDDYLKAHRFIRVLDDDEVMLTHSFLLDDVVERMRALADLDGARRAKGAALLTEFPVPVKGLIAEYQSLGGFYLRFRAHQRAERMFQLAAEAAAADRNASR